MIDPRALEDIRDNPEQDLDEFNERYGTDYVYIDFLEIDFDDDELMDCWEHDVCSIAVAESYDGGFIVDREEALDMFYCYIAEGGSL